MATKRRKVFPLTIRTKAELLACINSYHNNSDVAVFIKRAKLAKPRTYAEQLDRWLLDTGIEICDPGRKILLSEAGKLTNWRQYVRKHWDANQAQAQLWLRNNILCDHVTYYDGNSAAHDVTRDVKWPFKRKGAR